MAQKRKRSLTHVSTAHSIETSRGLFLGIKLTHAVVNVVHTLQH